MIRYLEFPTAADMLRAIPLLHDGGISVTDAYTPHAVEGLDELLPGPPSLIRPVMLAAAAAGAALAFGFQVWSAVIDYPINVGGRPLFSWPAFVPTAFEVMILGGAAAGFIAMLVKCNLTRLNHPVFEVPGFARASQDRFFLRVDIPGPEGRDDAASPDRFARLLGDGAPLAVREPPS